MSLNVLKKTLKSFNPFYWPWFIDIGIAFASFIVLVYFVYLAIIDFSSFERWDSLLSIFPLIYSTNSALSKINEDRKQKDNFERNLGPLIGDCQHVFEKHLPESLSTLPEIEKKVLDTHFEDWKKYKNIRSIEYQIIDTYLNNLASAIEISDGDKLFLKYVLVTSAFPLHFPNLVSEMKDAEYY